jgi:hypothetical protein
MEQAVGQAETFAVFATDQTCGAIDINGGGSDTTTDSYSSQSAADMASSPPVHDVRIAGHSQGGIGTNGNLNVNGNLTIGGTLTTPRTGSGACSNSNPNAITGVGSWSYGGTVPIGQALSYPTPDPPTTTPGTSALTLSATMGSIACAAAVSSSGWACSFATSASCSSGCLTLTPVTSTTLTLPNVTIGSNTNLIIAGATPTLNVNSFSIGNNATVSLATGTSVTMNLAGAGTTTPLDLSGGGTVNPSYDPSRFQIIYAGTGNVTLVGNNTISATIYAPNANVTTNGHGDFYGSVLSKRASINGGASIHYDTSLATKFKTLGNHVLTSFSWKKY